jgi:plasmid stability protein
MLSKMIAWVFLLEVTMTDLLVRDLDPSVIERLKAKAKQKGRSLQQEAKEILTQAAPMTREELEKMFEELDAMFPDGPTDFPIEDIIREEREKLGEW